ncbi:MAG: class I adenylate-forming enzyme family protein [Pseudomonadota bacterium]
MAWFSPRPLLLPQMLDLNAEARAKQPALIVDDLAWTWSELVTQCRRWAGVLTGLGLRKGDRVAVVMDNAPETVVALLGTVYGGFVAVPINVSVAETAITGMLSDSHAKVLVCNGAHATRLQASVRQLPTLLARISVERQEGWQTFSDLLTRVTPVSRAAEVTPTDECNIIYSSGTTGLPKGIVHDHRCRAAWAYDMAVVLRYHPSARTLCTLGLYSNITWVAMLATILAGGTLYVTRRFDVAATIDYIAANSITHTAMVPVQLQRMLESGPIDKQRVISLQSLMCCGSPLAPSVKQSVVDTFGSAFLELYGLTEGLVTVLQPEDMDDHLSSVGKPAPGQKIVILDNEDRICAAGESGEIVGYGPLQMAGYHDRPDANEEATWVDPDGQRWLRTGDIGKLDADGYLYLVDRKKDMIISGGQNIYPADIEAAILEHDDVGEVAVIGVASDRWGETPLAVFVGGADHEALVEWTNARVGKQQRISGAVSVAELPRNPNGKVLKRELRATYKEILKHA